MSVVVNMTRFYVHIFFVPFLCQVGVADLG